MFDVVIYFNFCVDEKCNINNFFAKNKFVVCEFFFDVDYCCKFFDNNNCQHFARFKFKNNFVRNVIDNCVNNIIEKQL